MGGEDQDREIGMQRPHFFHDRQPVPFRKPQIGNHQIEPLAPGFLQRGIGIVTGRDGKTHGGQTHRQELQQSLIVVDDQHLFFFHPLPLAVFAAAQLAGRLGLI